MFDYVDRKPVIEPARPRYMTATISAVAHVVVVAGVVALPILYASEQLPEPPTMMAFVFEAAPPPPPPPPPAPAPPAPEKPTPPKPEQPTLQSQPVRTQAAPIAAPVEAPAAVTPETGLEANAGARIEAGFESGVPGGVAGGVVGGAIGGIDGGLPPPPPPPKPQGPVRVGGNIKEPQLVHRVQPTYPPVAQSAQVEGSVILEATVNKQGRVQNVRVLKGHSLLESAAVAAVRQWRYEPLVLNGQPMEFILTVNVTFSIPR